MELHIPPERVPIETDADGVVRVGGTWVTLDTVVAAFDAGATPEEVVQQYPSVALADIYSVIAYHLRHQSDVRAYLAQRQRQAAEVREENESRFDPTGVRNRLLARRVGRSDVSYGNPQFDTKRSELGELVFRLKNRNDKRMLDPIADTAVQFLNGWKPPVDVIVPVPPSRPRAGFQPVIEIARAIGTRLSKPVNTAAVSKRKNTPELKNVFEYQRRLELLQGAFNVEAEAVGD